MFWFLSLFSSLKSARAWFWTLLILEVLNVKTIQGSIKESTSTMDGFYDQQVPFTVPGVGLVLYYVVWFSHSVPHSTYPWDEVHICFVFWRLALHGAISLLLYQKSCTDECRGRTMNDRKRKFQDTDLAHDSEGSTEFPSPFFFFSLLKGVYWVCQHARQLETWLFM